MSEENKDKDQLNEPAVPYTTSRDSSIKKTLRIMSFAKQEEETRNYSVSLTPAQRLQWLHEKRKESLKQLLLSDGTFPSIQRIISVRKIL